MTARLFETMMAAESGAGMATMIEPALDDLKKLIKHAKQDDIAGIHANLRNAYAAIDRLRAMGKI